MGLEAILAALSVIISGGGAYYSRKSAQPEIRKREICRSLQALLHALENVAFTGAEIGERLRGRNQRHTRAEELDTLIHLLDLQIDNLSNAQREFEFLAGIFEVQLPEISNLVLHLRGKKDRIEIVYTTARDVQLRAQRQLEPWETSRRLRAPTELRQVLANSRHGIEISQVDASFWKEDPNFNAIIHRIPELRDFIRQSCPMEYLI